MNFPTLPGFGGRLFAQFKDKELGLADASLLDEPDIAAWRATLASNPFAAMDLPAPRMKGIRHAGNVELHAGDPCPDISIGTNMYERCGLPMDSSGRCPAGHQSALAGI